ncbi:MAG: hypothetical protein IRY85_15150 [Micromonosporaceae bacterium]|nr:hypothetical protein [Micromonosporaceae bacterium]
MSVVSRRVASVPVRTSADTWKAVVALIAAPNDDAHSTLTAISNLASMLIAEEYTRDAPIVVIPASGPRVRIYTSHGEAAIEGDDEAQTPLATWPTAQPGWLLSLPCGIDDIDDARRALEAYPNIEVRDLTDGITVDAGAQSTAGRLLINYDELERS